jgi:CxxC-x17-CxxC domain-containing protein
MGKTTLLENMVIQDIMKGEGVGIVDPHGDFAEKILNFVPESRIKDVIYFAPHDIDWPIAFNVMEKVDPTQRHLVAAGLLGVFKKIWPDVWSPRMEYILNNCILALLEYPDSTLLGINRMLSDKDYRKEVVSKITDPVIKAFWTDEFAKYTDRFMTEASAAIQNKVGQFISNPLIRNIIGQSKSGFDLREIMDDKKILIMNLSKGRVGEENSRLIGAMLITKIYLAAMSRVDVEEKERSDFYLYVDEFQNFATESFKDILSEARKYRLDLILAHQYIAQMDEKVADAVFGNVGTLITFRVGAADAEFLEKEFEPEFMVQDLVNLGFAGIYLRLMIDGVPSRPFSATTLPPIKQKEASCADAIIESSREKYASSRNEVEEEIASWHAPTGPTEKSSFDDGARPAGASRSLPHAGSFRQAPSGEKEQPEMYEATCSVCNKRTYVPFKPDGKRPIFCKVHRAGPTAQAGQSPSPVFVERPKNISLKELEDRKRPAPKMDELRKVLNEVMTKEEPKNNKSGVIKPGDKIKFE